LEGNLNVKTLESNIKSTKIDRIVINTSINENQKQPYLEQKLDEANRLLKKFGLPKEVS